MFFFSGTLPRPYDFGLEIHGHYLCFDIWFVQNTVVQVRANHHQIPLFCWKDMVPSLELNSPAVNVDNLEELVTIQADKPGPYSFLKADINWERPVEGVDSRPRSINPGFNKFIGPFPGKILTFQASHRLQSALSMPVGLADRSSNDDTSPAPFLLIEHTPNIPEPLPISLSIDSKYFAHALIEHLPPRHRAAVQR